MEEVARKPETDYVVIEKCGQLSKLIGISQIKINFLLWNYLPKVIEKYVQKSQSAKCV